MDPALSPQKPPNTTMPSKSNPSKPPGPYKPTLIIHGGAGSITRKSLPPELYAQYHASLQSYLTSTRSLLRAGGTAIDAACHAVGLMEDDPLFNCGRGSVFTSDGTIEMEASLAVASVDDERLEYRGKVKRSAAVSMIQHTRHPILLARQVLLMADEDGGMGGTGTMHGHLSGPEVEEWGFRGGLERKGGDWFWTRRRWEEHRRGLRESGDVGGFSDDPWSATEMEDELPGLAHVLELPSQGTVGTVCMDSWGVVAVATSTGGLTNKRPGRIGDTPTVGAGFWAESWSEDLKEKLEEPKGSSSDLAISRRLTMAVKAEVGFWLGDCLVPAGQTQGERCHDSRSVETSRSGKASAVEEQPFIRKSENMVFSKKGSTRIRAVAMSGTGNGDSFLRTNACRTVAAISRYSTMSLEEAIHTVAGPDGELQRSAGDRWGRTGQGEGGIIGIEMVVDSAGKGEGRPMFDFNCGGLWRAYYERSDDGKEAPRVMVFREKY